MSQRHFYAGIGSRKTPADIMEIMAKFASAVEWNYNLVLRSGAAPGADQAFESGVRNPRNKEIFIPWRKFSNDPNHIVGFKTPQMEQEAERIAQRFHPNWAACSQGARAMHTRNVAQIFGYDLASPVMFVICWTPNGSGSGGTGQALRMAKAFDIPVFDLGLPDKGSVVADALNHITDTLESVRKL